jgi:uncharacterized membrane protein YdjX (TVP38/TMEM64 family)
MPSDMKPGRLPLTAGLLLGLIFIAVVIAMAGAGQDWLFKLLALVESGKREHLAAMMLAYVLAFAVLATLTLPVGTLFCLAAGYLFGIPFGFLAAMTGALLGATLTFVLVRCFGGARVRQQLSVGRTAPWLGALERDATWYLILLRIVPVAPYFAVNAAAAVTGIGIWHFLLATAAGLVPTTIVYAAVGSGLESLLEARDMLGPALLLEPEIGLPLLGLVFIIIASWLIRRRLLSHHSGSN